MMLILFGLLSVAFAALMRPSVVMAIVVFNVTLAVIGIGIVACFLTSGDRRAFWIAFSVFASGHWMLAFDPGFDASASHTLISTQVLRAIRPEVYPVNRGFNWYIAADRSPLVSNVSTFGIIGHCLFSLLAGLAAGALMWGIAPHLRREGSEGDG
jgi:hypothetical protein